MSFPQSIDPSQPPGTQSIGLGDDQIRGVKQFICDIFGIPALTTFTAPIATAGATGGYGLVPLHFLTNRTGITLNPGDWVTSDHQNPTGVILNDVYRTRRPMYVCRGVVANGALGVFASSGINPVKIAGTVSTGQYLYKSAVSLAAEDSGVGVEFGVPPFGAIGYAMNPSAGGLCVAMLTNIGQANTVADYTSPQCRLVKSGANLVLMRHNGRYILIDGRMETIPVGGVALGPGGAGNNVTYYIYAGMTGGLMILEASSIAAPTIDPTYGIAVRSGSPSRTLVGIARTITGPQWQDHAAQRFTLSYYNRRTLTAGNTFFTPRGTSSATPVEIHTEIRTEFLTWADEGVGVWASGHMSNSIAGASNNVFINLDGTTRNPPQGRFIGSGGTPGAPVTSFGLNWGDFVPEGYHYASLDGFAGGGGTTTYDRVLISVNVRG